jgi:uncharacterized repeat protein (TIGR02543 family)
MPANNLTITAQWVDDSEGVPFTVKHVRQALDGSYPASGDLVEYESRRGIPGKSTNAPPKTYTGFTPQTIVQKTVAENGSTVMEIKYARNSHNLEWNTTGGNALTGEYTHGNTLYGTPIILPDEPRRKDYLFDGWFKDAALTVPLEANATMPDEPLKLYAKWKWYSAKYTVNHYQESLDGGYELAESDGTWSDTIGFQTSATAKDYTGFTAQQEPIEQKTIEADGSTVVDIKYTRNSHSVTWAVYGAELTGEYTVGDTKYGTPIILPDEPRRTGYTFAGWYKDANMTIPLEANATMPDEPLTLYGKWTGIPLWVNNVQISGDNAHDVLSDGGSVTYDFSTNTLTLNNANLTVARNFNLLDNAVILSAISSPLTLNLIGNNTITGADASGDSYCIYADKLIIEGSGTLTASSGDDNDGYGYTSAIYANHLTINGGTLNLTGDRYGLVVNGGLNGALILNSGSLTSQGGVLAVLLNGVWTDNLNFTFMVGDEPPGTTYDYQLTWYMQYKYVHIHTP